MPGADRKDFFVSYNRSDKTWAEWIAWELEEAGYSTVLQAWDFRPGQNFVLEMQRAAVEAERTLAVLSPDYLAALFSQPEWAAAFAMDPTGQGGKLLPVRVRECELPGLLAQIIYVDLVDRREEAAREALLAGARRGRAKPQERPRFPGARANAAAMEPPAFPGAEGRPSPYWSMAPPPEAFIHRSEYDRVVAALCSAKEGARGATVGIMTALRGAGGFGKTALAQAVCRDPRIQERYPDGILWATMGEDIDPPGRLSRVRELIRWWTDQEPLAYETATAAGAKLRELLNSHRVLLVVDDVWRPEDVTPFQGLAAGSALLVTTRDSRTLPLDRIAIEVDAMASSEAVALLGAGLPNGSPARLAALAARLGEWPLLLTIVNGQLRKLVTEEGLTLDEALREVGEALDAEGLTAFDREDAESRNHAVARALNASLQRLSEMERQRYEELAIFPEDRHVPLAVLERLWQISSYEAKKLCGRLHDLSLLLRFDRQAGAIRLHDVVRAYLLKKTQSERPAVHRRLLDAFRPASGRWPDLPRKERYLWRNLPHHLVGGGERETFLALLIDFDYLQAKLEATDVNSLLADYAPSAEQNEELRLIQGALRLSAHVLAKDKKQLAPQLLGRLMDREEPRIQRLVEGAKNWRGAAWFRPIKPNFIPPGGPLVRTFEGHTAGVTALSVLDRGLESARPYVSSKATLLWSLRYRCWTMVGWFQARRTGRYGCGTSRAVKP